MRTITGIAGAFILLAAGADGLVAQTPPATADPPSDVPCKMKRIEDGVWCEDCLQVLEDPAAHAKDEITQEHRTEKIKVCVVEYYHCTKCGTPQIRPGKCHGMPREKLVDRSRVRLRCESCRTSGTRPGPCPADTCRKKKHKIKLLCDKNRDFPHGPDEAYR